METTGSAEGRWPSAEPPNFDESPGVIIFRAADGTHGSELWSTDGTAARTQLLKYIRPDSHAWAPTSLTKVGAVAFFVADDGTTGREVWMTDGTAAGTVLVADLQPGVGESRAEWLTAFGERLLFSAYPYTTGPWEPYAVSSYGDALADPPEACDSGDANGSSGSCCNTICNLVSSGTACRANAGACDVVEECDGVSPGCPSDVKQTGVCRPALDAQCDFDEHCDGIDNECPADVIVIDGEACDDSDSCTETDACNAGVCTPGALRGVESANLKVRTRDGAANDKLALKSTLALNRLTSPPDHGGLSLMLVASDTTLFYDASISPDGCEDIDGDGLRYRFRSDDPASESGGIRQITVTLVPDRDEVRVAIKATKADLSAALGQSSVTLVLQIGGDPGDCAAGLDVPCRGAAHGIACGN